MNLARPGGGGRSETEEQKIGTGKWKLRDRGCARRAEQIENSFIYEAAIDPWIKREFSIFNRWVTRAAFKSLVRNGIIE